jgi:hypothetical protein
VEHTQRPLRSAAHVARSAKPPQRKGKRPHLERQLIWLLGHVVRDRLAPPSLRHLSSENGRKKILKEKGKKMMRRFMQKSGVCSLVNHPYTHATVAFVSSTRQFFCFMYMYKLCVFQAFRHFLVVPVRNGGLRAGQRPAPRRVSSRSLASSPLRRSAVFRAPARPRSRGVQREPTPRPFRVLLLSLPHLRALSPCQERQTNLWELRCLHACRSRARDAAVQ